MAISSPTNLENNFKTAAAKATSSPAKLASNF
jgi:hypothetical protein